MEKYCSNCGKPVSDPANYCASCGAYIGKNIEGKVKEFREHVEILNLTKEVHIFTVYVVAFTAALNVWAILNIADWQLRLASSVFIGVLSVFITRFLLKRYLN